MQKYLLGKKVLILLISIVFFKCQDPQMNQVAQEEVTSIRPNLPSVPHIPPPTSPIQYDDGTYSVRGLRKNIEQLVGQEVRVKAYAVKIYEAPQCPEGSVCPKARMPHLWLADDLNETSNRKLLRVVGYAQNQEEIDLAKEAALKGKEPPELEVGRLPIAWDWQIGKQYIVTAKLTYRSGGGFSDTYGLLEYKAYNCLNCPPPEEETKNTKAN